MAGFEGKWKLDSQENFDDYMKAIGVGMVMRKLGGSTKPALTIGRSADKLSVKSESSVKTTEFEFKFGEEFPETTADGRKVQSTIVEEGPRKWVHEQKGEYPSTIIRELQDDNTILITLKAKDVVAKRVYKRDV